jgi:hypothetical protein
MTGYQYIVHVYHRPHPRAEIEATFYGPFPTEDAANEWADANWNDWDTLTLEEAE